MAAIPDNFSYLKPLLLPCFEKYITC